MADGAFRFFTLGHSPPVTNDMQDKAKRDEDSASIPCIARFTSARGPFPVLTAIAFRYFHGAGWAPTVLTAALQPAPAWLVTRPMFDQHHRRTLDLGLGAGYVREDSRLPSCPTRPPASVSTTSSRTTHEKSPAQGAILIAVNGNRLLNIAGPARRHHWVDGRHPAPPPTRSPTASIRPQLPPGPVRRFSFEPLRSPRCVVTIPVTDLASHADS